MMGRLVVVVTVLLCAFSSGRIEAQWGGRIDVPKWGRPNGGVRLNSQEDETHFYWRRESGEGNHPSGNYPPNQQSDIVPGILGIIGKGIDAAVENEKRKQEHEHHNHQGPFWPNQGYQYPQYQRPQYQRPQTVIVRPQVVTPPTEFNPPPTEVKPNSVPVADPEPTKVEVAVVPNAFTIDGSFITAADVQNTKEDAQAHVEDTVDDIRDNITDKLKEDVDSLEGYSDTEKREIKDRLKKGESVDDLIKVPTVPADAAERLLKADDAFESLEEMADDAQKGRLRPRDIDDFEDDFGDMVDSGKELTQDLDTLSEDSFWIDQMDRARPGSGLLPSGMESQIIYVPNMPAGRVVYLGNGTLLVGTGGVTDGVVITSGSAVQTVGLSVGAGQPVPDSEADVIVDGVLLINLGEETVNYNVDSDQFTMSPDYQQHLPGSKTWAVEFDRGGDHGKAKYGIANGTYGFTPTEKGWELYEQPEYEITIDNTNNKFPFQYVLDSVQKTVAAGQSNQHKSRYPLVIRFDDGSGQVRQKALEESEYAVAVSSAGTLDLFEPSDVKPPLQMEQIAKMPTLKGRALLQLDDRSRGSLFGGGERSPAGSSRGLLSFH